MIKLRPLSTAKRLSILAVLLGVLGAIAGFALAASSPPAPTITRHPASSTTSSAASFSFKDSQSKVTFLCSRDGSAFTPCKSPKRYTALSTGSHKFSVKAKDASGSTSSATSFTWTIDRGAPIIGIFFPLNNRAYNGVAWSTGCKAGAGVCGATSDPRGISTVTVSVRQRSSGKYWNGTSYGSAGELYRSATLSSPTKTGAQWFLAVPRPSPDGQYVVHVRATDKLGNATSSSAPATTTFTINNASPPTPTLTSKPANPTNQSDASLAFTDSQAGVTFLCRIDTAAFAPCTSPQSYSGLTDGQHTFFLEARDSVGNTSSAMSYGWVVDTAAPPAPVITASPDKSTTSTDAQFSFTESEPGATLQCQLDGDSFTTCTSPKSYSNLGVGSHTFKVRAVDGVGNTSSAATSTWQVTGGIAFTITGDVPNPLFPGMTAKAIPLTVTNPNNVPIVVTSLSATVNSTGSPSCATSWFETADASIPSSGLSVPANGSLTVPTANDPTLRMIESHTNQDACMGASLTLNYSGSAHS